MQEHDDVSVLGHVRDGVGQEGDKEVDEEQANGHCVHDMEYGDIYQIHLWEGGEIHQVEHDAERCVHGIWQRAEWLNTHATDLQNQTRTMCWEFSRTLDIVSVT